MSDKRTVPANPFVSEIVKALALEDLPGNYNEPYTSLVQPSSLSGLFKDILSIAKEFGVEARGEVLVEELTERTEIIRHKLKFVEDRPRVACIENVSPVIFAGNIVPELTEIAGGIPVLTERGKASSPLDPEALKAAGPGVIIIALKGAAIEQTLQDIGRILQWPGWADLEAVKNNRVYIADGSKYFYKPGPAMVDTLELLAEIIQPKQFVFGLEGSGWVKFEQ